MPQMTSQPVFSSPEQTRPRASHPLGHWKWLHSAPGDWKEHSDRTSCRRLSSHEAGILTWSAAISRPVRLGSSVGAGRHIQPCSQAAGEGEARRRQRTEGRKTYLGPNPVVLRVWPPGRQQRRRRGLVRNTESQVPPGPTNEHLGSGPASCVSTRPPVTDACHRTG